MSSEFILSGEPELHNPTLIIGLPDVGYVGLRVIDYLKSKLRAQEFGHIEPQRFSTVPWVSVKNGVIEDLELLRNGFSFWKNRGGGNDLVIFKSEQPTARPYEYVEAILDVAERVGARRVYIVGSFGAVGVTHLEPPAVLGVVNMPYLTELLVEAGVQPYPQYKGIGTIHSSFLWFAKERKLESLGLWAPIPHYVARLPFPWSNYPGASLCIIEKLNVMEGLQIDTTELEKLSKRTADEMSKIYEQLHEEAKNEFVYPGGEQTTAYSDKGLGQMSDEELKGMMKDIDDFFRKRKQ
ncbi:MAG: PAC2 family protein [Dehalococcoidia bacterium]|nr:PAC2 family protein [Dehalococcoidia bacterium]